MTVMGVPKFPDAISPIVLNYATYLADGYFMTYFVLLSLTTHSKPPRNVYVHI